MKLGYSLRQGCPEMFCSVVFMSLPGLLAASAFGQALPPLVFDAADARVAELRLRAIEPMLR